MNFSKFIAIRAIEVIVKWKPMEKTGSITGQYIWRSLQQRTADWVEGKSMLNDLKATEKKDERKRKNPSADSNGWALRRRQPLRFADRRRVDTPMSDSAVKYSDAADAVKESGMSCQHRRPHSGRFGTSRRTFLLPPTTWSSPLPLFPLSTLSLLIFSLTEILFFVFAPVSRRRNWRDVVPISQTRSSPSEIKPPPHSMETAYKLVSKEEKSVSDVENLLKRTSCS